MSIFKDKVLLITGGTGSFGNAVLRRFLDSDIKEIRILSRDETKRDASLGLINALSVAKKGDGVGIQILFRPTDEGWTRKSLQRVQNLRDGKKGRREANNFLGRLVYGFGNLVGDLAEALWKPPEAHDPYKDSEKVLSNLEQEEITKIEEKTKYAVVLNLDALPDLVIEEAAAMLVLAEKYAALIASVDPSGTIASEEIASVRSSRGCASYEAYEYVKETSFVPAH